MTALIHLRPAVAVGALFAGLGAASGAMAAVTVQDVWADTQSWLSANGTGTVTTASETEAGGVLTVTGIQIVVTGEDSGASTTDIDQITFTDQGDGTVAVAYGPTYTTRTEPAPGTPGTAETMAMTYEGASITASGDPGAITYDSTVDKQSVHLTDDDGSADMTVVLADVASTWTSTGTDTKTADGSMTAAAVSVDGTFAGEEGGAPTTLSGKVADLSVSGSGTVPSVANSNPAKMIAAGLAVDGTGSVGQGQFVFSTEATTDSPAVQGTVALTGAEGTFVIDGEAMTFAETVSGLDVQVTGSPVPVMASLGTTAFSVTLPVAAGETPQPWSTKIEIGDLSLGEELWAMFDPGAQLPRDPATLLIDLSGTATMTKSLADSSAMDEAAVAGESPAPGQVNSADINALRLDVMGAELTGTGSFTFNNDDLVTFGGMPAPTGSATFNLTGINALLDKLVAVGLVPQEQLMGAQMMIGMFAKPNGDDAFVSEIEVSGDGQVLVNGQRMR